jgi:hypothetical protein
MNGVPQPSLPPHFFCGFPVYLRLEEGCCLEFVIRNVNAAPNDPAELQEDGRRILDRSRYNTIYEGQGGQVLQPSTQHSWKAESSVHA